MPNIESIKIILKNKKERIISIPESTVIDKKHLGELTNEEFVAAFKELQNLVIAIYEAIEQDPLKYGYPLNSKQILDDTSLNSRLSDSLLMLCVSGKLEGDELIVDKKAFKQNVRIYKQINLMIDLISEYGFYFDDYCDKNNETFVVTYPDNSKILYVLYCYAKAMDLTSNLPCFARVMYENFSHRWLEDPNEQKYEAHFLAEMDYSSAELQNLQYWIHAKAKQYGFSVPIKQKYNRGCIRYTKGSKQFVNAGERTLNGENMVFVKVIYRKVFETHIEKIKALSVRFPNVFGSSNSLCDLCTSYIGGLGSGKLSCNKRINYEINGKSFHGCSNKSFYFYNPSFDDMSLILELFLLENNLKMI